MPADKPTVTVQLPMFNEHAVARRVIEAAAGMAWRSAVWGFVNFTGTAGVWRAAGIESVGGWRSTSLVEDCELSFRHLSAGYRTKFVKEIVVPAELPATYTAYKAQQKRWTQGWAQLQRLHLRTLLFDYPSTRLRRRHLPVSHVHFLAVAGLDGLGFCCCRF